MKHLLDLFSLAEPILRIAGAVILGGFIGSSFADIDLAPPLPVRHRSAWTHGVLVPLAIRYMVEPNTSIFWFALGFLPAYAVHLVYDMFPKKWKAGAKISWFPLGKWRMPALLSFIWLGIGAIVAGAVLVYLIKQVTW
jgi:uncharacterized protein YjeT (DUF2065 family)